MTTTEMTAATTDMTTAAEGASTTHVAATAPTTMATSASAPMTTTAVSSCENRRHGEGARHREEHKLLDRRLEHDLPLCWSVSSVTSQASFR